MSNMVAFSKALLRQRHTLARPTGFVPNAHLIASTVLIPHAPTPDQ
jgi:hypothetical protein